MIKQLFVLVLMISLLGCSSKPKTPYEIGSSIQINASLSASAALKLNDIPDEATIYQLTAEQQQDFNNYFTKKLAAGLGKHQIVADYIGNLLYGFNYENNTYSASEALSLKSGNCMSYALVTAAFARLAGVEYGFREVSSAPVFQQEKGAIWVVYHVQTRLYDPDFVEEENTLYFERPGILIDYLPEENSHVGQALTSTEFSAMYYNNKAAELMAQEQLANAFIYALKAHQQDPASIATVNLLAVLHRQLGDEVVAESLYQSAMAMNIKNISVLNNYKILLEKQDRHADADVIRERIKKLDDPNPYRWLEMAYQALHQEDLTLATRYFNKVIELAPYVKEAYVGLYNINLVQGNVTEAANVLVKVFPWVYEENDRRFYKGKLLQLKQYSK